MGMIGRVLATLFGNRNVVAETVEVFRENAEGAAERRATLSAAALTQFAAEFQYSRQTGFDRFMDGLNRVPRPALALGTLGLFIAAMVEPVWFASRMAGLALIPEPLWWLLGAVVSFYFGARHQVKGQEFQRSIATTLARMPEVVNGLDALAPAAPNLKKEPMDEPIKIAPSPHGLHNSAAGRASGATIAPARIPSGNAALDAWRTRHG
ncbi:holin family protein [Oceaniglobus ichthyenteri]|uniref:holin family protein n=1 Tax=Oceaniglobus ichthyenteri TaxID=2136177 RepID=UPI000D35A04C|nr:holin family protein [Oceaniglobus ichthyenteri]